MRVPAGVLKAMTHLVAVVASLLLVLVLTAVLPLVLGSVVLLGMIVGVGLVTGGVLEGPAVRLTTRASAPTDGELQVLTRIPELAGTHVLVCRSTADTAAPVVIMGPFSCGVGGAGRGSVPRLGERAGGDVLWSCTRAPTTR